MMVIPRSYRGSRSALSPVEGKNLAGDEESYTTLEKKIDRKTEDLDETHQFAFDAVASGAYKLSVPSGWRVRLGEGDLTAEDYTPKGADGKVGNTFNPLEEDVALDVTPATGLVYGVVVDADGFPPVDPVTVTANGVSTVTDSEGRYILEGISPETRTVDRVPVKNAIFVTPGNGILRDFVGNQPREHDIDLKSAASGASVSGTVRASGTNAPVAGVRITVDGKDPTNGKSGKSKLELWTGADGTYTAEFPAGTVGESADVEASKTGMTFVPAVLATPAHPGAEISGLDFVGFVNATISGRVRAPNGRAMGGILVKARLVADRENEKAAADSATTTGTGTFSLNVPFGSYDIAASTGSETPDGIRFDIPTGFGTVNVAPGQTVNVGTIEAKSAKARNVSARRMLVAMDNAATENVDESQTYTNLIKVSWVGEVKDVPEGYNDAVAYTAETCVTSVTETCAAPTSAWTPAGLTGVGANPPVKDTTINVPGDSDGGFKVRFVTMLTSDETITGITGTLTLYSVPFTVTPVDPSASVVSAKRAGAGTAVNPDSVKIVWTAVTNENSTHRVVIEVEHSGLESKVWLVAPTDGTVGTALTANGTRTWALTIPVAPATGTAEPVTVTGWTFAGSAGGAAPPVPRADLLKALNVRVDSRQGTDADFKAGTAVRSVPAKP